MKNKNLLNYFSALASIFLLSACSSYSFIQTSVPEEGSVNFVKISQDIDNVEGNRVYTKNLTMTWSTGHMLTLSPDGNFIAYISDKNGIKNIMVKNADKAGSSIQRTFRNNVTDLSWSQDGENIIFSEARNNRSSIYIVKAKEGSVMQQITNGISDDVNPIYSIDGKQVFFSRRDTYGYSIWSFNTINNLFTQYSLGYTPCPIKKEKSALLCTRNTSDGRGEIWKIDYETGVETLILSDNNKSYSTPQMSPDGQWIVCMGSSMSNRSYNRTNNTLQPQTNNHDAQNYSKQNLDIYVVRADGTNLTQLTYHPGNDVSPIWSQDGKDIFFISQRGTEKGTWNIWKMSFNLQ
jgi:Tol biopolymer transport system component